MAAFTAVNPSELTQFLAANSLPNYDEFQPVEGGSVNSNFSVVCGPSRYFLRLYEEQDSDGAARERQMVGALAARGVPTPLAIAHGELSRRPAALFGWVPGVHACQASVTQVRARAAGEALARIHASNVVAGEGRFDELALRKRLATIDTCAFPVARLEGALAALTAARDANLPRGITHGDLFRDNVLFENEKSDAIVALLDFESASHGAFAYDVAVTVLAWCYGDALDVSLAHAMLDGYESIRPFLPHEKHAFCTEMRMAALRFTITRITDYAMRGGAGKRVMKDWRRFLARLDALETVSASTFFR